MHEAMLWEPAGTGVRCLLCPHACLIADGARGVCGVRENHGGRLIALTYAQVSSVAVDPIEKKPVFHYRPGTLAFSLGSVGCTMRCGHCQNWQISRARPGGPERLERIAPDEAVRLAVENRCEGVAFTYNEPVIWVEYVCDVAAEARRAGLYTVMVTNGYVTEAGLDAFGPLIDVWRVDIKGITDETYRAFCHVRSVRPVLDAAVRARRRWGMHVEVVTNVVPTIDDDDATLRGIASFIADELGPDTPWHVTRFFPYLEFAHLGPTPVTTLVRAREIGRECGLRHVFIGNTHRAGAEDTRCPSCGALLIGRDGYHITRRLSVDGRCPECGAESGVVG